MMHRIVYLFFAVSVCSLPVVRTYATTVTVTSVEDAGPGTLRQALLDAASGACEAPCRIVIHRPGIDSAAIYPSSPLPDIVADGMSIECGQGSCAIYGARGGYRSGLRIVGARNVAISGLIVAGFEGHGLFIDGGGGHVIRGNTFQLNGLDGVAIRGAGDVAVEDNEIVSSAGNGIYVETSARTTIRGNDLGRYRFAGSPGTGNKAHGVHLHSSDLTRIEENRVEFNALHGILITGDAHGNAILSNSIESNGLLGIDLGGDGPDPIDELDLDVGPNHRLNAPELAIEGADCSSATVRVSVRTTPAMRIRVQLFATNAPDLFAQGAALVGDLALETDAAGRATAVANIPTFRGAARLSATATSADGDTSEFAEPVPLPSCSDLSIAMEVPPLASVDRVVDGEIVVRNESFHESPTRAFRITFPPGSRFPETTLKDCVREAANQVLCQQSPIPVHRDDQNGFVVRRFRVALPSVSGSYEAFATLLPEASDGNPGNDVARVQFSTTADADLSVTIDPIRDSAPFDPGAIIPIQVNLWNHGASAAEDAVFRLDVSPPVFVGLVSYGFDWICTGTATGVECRNPSLGGFRGPSLNGNPLTFELHAPDSGTVRELNVSASVATVSPDFRPENDAATAVRRLYPARYVTNNFDAGEGSLRQTLLDIRNDDCTDYGCKIMFRIPRELLEDGIIPIRPATPLPAITTSGVIVDGYSQTILVGNTNEKGPEIVIDGSRSTPGNGLEIRAEGVDVRSEIRHLVINKWKGNGVLFWADENGSTRNSAVAGCYIGTDPAGAIAVPNTENGVAVKGNAVGSISSGPRDCQAIIDPICPVMLVSGNAMYGIRNEGLGVSVGGAQIGTTVDPDVPLPNGASGVRVDGCQGCALVVNRIAFNANDGVEVHGDVELYLWENSIGSNGDLGLDVNGDGVSPNDLPDLDGVQNYPEILSAEWDAATGSTRVTIRIPGYVALEYPRSVGIRLFRSSEPDALGFGEGEEQLAISYETIPADGRLEMIVKGDLTRTWLTAHAYVIDRQIPEFARYVSTSEFGPAFRATGGE